MELKISTVADIDFMKKVLDDFNKKSIFIYGAGSFGKEMYYFLKNHGLDVYGFLDRRADTLKEYCGKTVYNLENIQLPETEQEVCVLFAIVMDKDERKKVMEEIKNAGFVHVEEAQFYRSIHIIPDDMQQESLQEYYIAKKNRIEEAYSVLADEKSKFIYKANIKAHFCKDFSDCLIWEDSLNEQYFPKDIKLSSGYNRFIDCGGYIGDTIRSLLERECVQAVASFEPDLYNFKYLADFCKDKRIEIFCFPCAVGDRTSWQRFSPARGSGTICDEGEITVLSVSLDEVLNGFRPTFIKMDIEGAELQALIGAKGMICENIPDLAICVYHNINHLWDAILLLQSWNLGYAFFLRSYNAYTMETVLYATKQD